jgi:hypothetical protein
MLAHIVYFTLESQTPEAIQQLVSACHQFLSDHDGVAFFGVGTRTEDLQRPVNQTDFDVALHIVFESRADHDRYQTHPRHLEFIDRNKESWAKVRVFDTDLVAAT